MPNWEIPNASLQPRNIRAVMFDFDGTLSLIREGWANIMAQLGAELLHEQQLHREPEAELMLYLEREMLLLSGKPSIFQMQRLADEVQHRGGTPPIVDELLQEFLRRLLARGRERIDDLESRAVPPAAWTVPGSHDLLERLQQRGLPLYLVSGTDRVFVEREAQLLDLTRFFGERIFAPANNTPTFNKRDVLAGILREHNLTGEQLLSFGDGYSETVEVKRVGGIAIGVASQEVGIAGMNAMKRELLIELGADIIVPDYTESAELLNLAIAPETA